MQKLEKKYKRILIVNDDNAKEEFLKKYKGINKWEDDILYCQNITQTLEYLIENEHFGFDKILLDIKIKWEVEEKKYLDEIKKFVDVDSMEKDYGGFILFMYLLAKGFPINRIAFLSAYIIEEDPEKEKKEEIIKYLQEQGRRTSKTDDDLRELINQVPSQKENMLQLLESSKYKQRELTPYEEIRKLLEHDLKQETNLKKDSEKTDTETARGFFNKISSTGLIMKNRINKGNTDKLLTWLQNNEEEELESYYAFRNVALNICDELIKYYLELKNKKEELEKEINESSSVQEEDWKEKLINENSRKEKLARMKKEGIYYYGGNNQQAYDILKKYPPQYFIDILNTVKNMLDLNISNKNDIDKISNNIVNNLISYWEGMDDQSSYQNHQKSKLKYINEFSTAMVLKFTRNWKMHNLIKDIDFSFMRFIFFLSATSLGHGKTEIQENLPELVDISAINGENQEISMEEIFESMNKKLNKKTYALKISQLYGEYGRDAGTKLQISKNDIYKLFWLCLHFPYIEGCEIKYVEDECKEKSELSKKLEQFVVCELKKEFVQKSDHC